MGKHHETKIIRPKKNSDINIFYMPCKSYDSLVVENGMEQNSSLDISHDQKSKNVVIFTQSKNLLMNVSLNKNL